MIEIILSSLYIVCMFFIGCKLPIANTEVKRKITHIMVSLWWVILSIFFSYSYNLLFVPVVSYITIYLLSKYNKGLSLDRNDNVKEYGVPLYFIGMFGLLIIINCFELDLKTGVVFTIPLIFGDSAAAICGKKYGHKHLLGWFKPKTIVGSCAMLIVSTLSLLLYDTFIGSSYNYYDLIIISVIATIIEMISIKGIDNLTIPCATAILYLIVKG